MLVMAEGCSSGNRKLTRTTKYSRLSQLQTGHQRSSLCSTYASSAGVTLCTRGWAAGLMAACEEPTANRKYGERDRVMAAPEHNHNSCTCAGVLQTGFRLQTKLSLAARLTCPREATATGVVANSGTMLSTVLGSGRLGHWRGAPQPTAVGSTDSPSHDSHLEAKQAERLLLAS